MRSSRRARLREWALAIACVLGMAGCGGGGGGGSSGSTPSSPPTPPPATGQNVLPIVVDAGPANTNNVDVPFVSVTLCAPGSTSNCQTIDHVLLDTGSTGLRIMSSVLSPSLAPALVQQKAGNGNPLAECIQFADGSYVWGPVKAADLKLGGESVSSLAIQIIGDPAYANIPSACSGNGGQAQNTVQLFGANGVLGVAAFQQDFGAYATDAANLGQSGYPYYACTGATCQAVTVALPQQIQNPVGLLASDNNGVVINLPAVAATGAATVTGTLVLGIGTQANNALGSAVVFALDANGNFTTQFNNRSYASSFIDSGSNALYFPDAAIPVCSSGFFCPTATLQLTATNLGMGTNGSSGTVNFSVANADSLFATGNNAFNNLAAPGNPPSFDWGLPFFFNRSVYTAIEGRSTPRGNGPYVAY